MNLDLITAVLGSSTRENIDALLDDNSTVFWVDWREDETDIVSYCESVLETGNLEAEWEDVNTPRGVDLVIHYKGKTARPKLVEDAADRHLALCALNEILAPEFEIRFCIDSKGGDTLAFLALPASLWRDLEEGYGDAVPRHFYRFSEKPNLFTDELSF